MKRIGIKIDKFTVSQKQVFLALERKISRFEYGARKLIELRSSRDWNIANSRIRDYVQPLFTELSNTLAKFSQHYSAKMQRDAEKVAEISAIVPALLLLTAIFLLIIGTILPRSAAKKILFPIKNLSDATNKIEQGIWNFKLPVNSYEEIGQLSGAFSSMRGTVQAQLWMEEGIASLNARLLGNQSVDEFALNTIQCLSDKLDAPLAAFLRLAEDGKKCKLLARVGLNREEDQEFEPTEVYIEKAVRTGKPIWIELNESGFSYTAATNHFCQKLKWGLIYPIAHPNIEAVLEFYFAKNPPEEVQKLLDSIAAALLVGLQSACERERVQYLLAKSQKQSNLLEEKKQELESTNHELETQATALKESQAELLAQSEQIQEQNAELEIAASELVKNKEELHIKNKELVASKRSAENKAVELQQANAIKTAFMANMSHELRTPLNSILILSKLLSENSQHHLSAKEMEYSQTIRSSATDLLKLINDLLDFQRLNPVRLMLASIPLTSWMWSRD